ncbi:hypothetical protein AGMMS49960_17500 [Betaproteobacteria bacterium]|nr:hypothetical protein AGMMS49543_08060 [Betaproteobacteria bacterium]GHU03325.1 hypothetical protein AGMMS49960_17500 [Betaproteobacteria bacterium]GHU06773.1 hypothetical protein AGMMS50225_02650 [Betaproteobacteria bacterium]GHU18136.1 hypothetical protein AGMMS50243_07600 [Betaproteobacteria bacterium]
MKTSTLTLASRHQRGATLIVAMILLMIMSLLAITSLRASIQGERMSSATFDRNLAFQAAEAGLRMGEKIAQKWAVGDITTPDIAAATLPTPDGACPSETSNSAGLYLFPDPDCGDVERWSSDSLWHDIDSSDIVDDSTFTDDVLSLSPKYIVELVNKEAPCDPTSLTPKLECYRFRVTATSASANDRSKVVLQSIYATDGIK